jgi:hypothetical protein
MWRCGETNGNIEIRFTTLAGGKKVLANGQAFVKRGKQGKL